MRFEFATATRIIFGTDTLYEVAPLAVEMGQSALVVTGRQVERATPLLEQLHKYGIGASIFSITGEPTIAMAMAGVRQADEAMCELVIGFGGGSVLDAGKAIAALMGNRNDLLDYLEVIGRGQPLTQPPAPYIAIPTTAGTGAEVTRNAVLTSPEHRVKVSLRSPLMIPRVAVVDPTLTYSMPPSITASTGLDALTQVMEPYVCQKTNVLTDGICREGMRRAARSLQHAFEDGHNAVAREDMAITSLFGGLALANAQLGAVHGFAAPLGGMFPAAAHGVVCARLLPFVMETNVKALQTRLPDSPTLARYDEIAQILTGKITAQAADGVDWVQNLCLALKVPALSSFGLTPADFPAVVAKAQKASSMKGNPISLTDEELTAILQQAI